MPHLDDDRLTQRALGNRPLTEHESSHLERCPYCRTELDHLHHIHRQARHTQHLHDLPMPPHRVWNRIQAELGISRRGEPPAPVALQTDPPPHRMPLAYAAATVGDELNTRRTRRSGPGRLTTVLTAAAAAAIAAAVTLVVTRQPDTVPAAAPCAGVTEIRLQALPGAPTAITGSACLSTTTGQRRLHIHTTAMPSQPDGDYEAWLLDATSLNGAALRVEALGVIDGTTDQDYPVPANLDLSNYRIIDISAEPHDGNAAHSGKSLLRGTLG